MRKISRGRAAARAGADALARDREVHHMKSVRIMRWADSTEVFHA